MTQGRVHSDQGRSVGAVRLADLATAASVATLNLLGLFRQLVFASEKDLYYLPEFAWPDHASALLVLAGLSLLIFAAIRALRRLPRHLRRPLSGPLLAAALLNPLYFLKNLLGTSIYDISNSLTVMQPVARTALLLVSIALLAALVRHAWSILRAIRVALLVMAPLSLLIGVQLCQPPLAALLGPREGQPETADPRGSSRAAAMRPRTPRLLLLVLDELDYRLAFEERPESLELPELDRLAEAAIALTNARLASWETASAIPALLTGLPISGATVADRSTLLVGVEGDAEARSLSTTPNLFSEAASLGLTTSVVGYYLPYRRLFPGLFEECYDVAAWSPFHLDGPLPGGAAFRRGLGNALVSTLPGSSRISRVATYPRVLDRAKSLAGRFDVNLLYVHVQLPHAPYIFDREAQRLTRFNLSPVGYFDNLALADRFVGELRGVMEQTGLWETSTVVVTSDHGWRHSERFDGRQDARVPLLLKMPGQESPYTYNLEFSAMRLKELTLAILAQELVDPTDVIGWMQAGS